MKTGTNEAVGDSQTLAALCMASTETATSIQPEPEQPSKTVNQQKAVIISLEEEKFKVQDAENDDDNEDDEARPGDGKIPKKRKRLTQEVARILEANYQRNANWDVKTIATLAVQLDLTQTKVYKWRWDRHKKEIIRCSLLQNVANQQNSQEIQKKSLLSIHFKKQMKILMAKQSAEALPSKSFALRAQMYDQ